MDIATNDSGGVLPVHILRERVGKGENGGGVREVVKVDVYEKYEVGLIFPFLLPVCHFWFTGAMQSTSSLYSARVAYCPLPLPPALNPLIFHLHLIHRF